MNGNEAPTIQDKLRWARAYGNVNLTREELESLIELIEAVESGKWQTQGDQWIYKARKILGK